MLSLLQEAALTNARLRRDPGEPQVEDHTPDVEHASDLGGGWGDKFPEMPKVKPSRARSQAPGTPDASDAFCTMG